MGDYSGRDDQMNRQLERRKIGKVSYLTGGHGKTALLLHGIPGSAFTWEDTANQLIKDCRVVIPDLLGFGSSELPEGDYYLAVQATQIHTLLSELNVQSFYLIGHDFGGPVGLTMMRIFPELRVEGLVLSNTNVFTDTYIPPPLRLASNPTLGPLFFKFMVGNRWALRMLYQLAVRKKDKVSWAQFSRHLTPSGIEYTRLIFQRSLADLKKNYAEIEEMLPGLQVPTLVIWGDTDPFFSTKVAQRTQAAIPGSALKIYENTGHFVPEEQPDRLAGDLRSFLDVE